MRASPSRRFVLSVSSQVEFLISDYRDEINASAEWTPLSTQKVVPRLIAIIMGRVLVGPGLNREEEWVSSVTQFVADVYLGGLKLKQYSHFTRPFAARFLIPEIRRVWRHQATARRKLVPILQSRSVTHEAPPGCHKNLDLLQWLLENNFKQSQPKTFEQLAELASVAFVGSTNTTATTLTNLLLDIAARPKDLEVLRKEIDTMQYANDVMHQQQRFSISNTSKLDSFMKESQRLNPAHLSMFASTTPSPCKLICNRPISSSSIP